uniref:Copper transport protein n=1 Tax=Panagrellus redivivus TaxID=6233 RepID=A0A7E4W1A2_PANRE
MPPLHGTPGGHAFLLHFSEREYILFEFWKIGSLNGIVGSCLLVVLICILAEAVDVIRQYLAKQHVPQDENVNLEYGKITKYLKTTITSYRAQMACLYGFQAILTYMMVLIVITFNVWLIISVGIGKALGYFFFAGSPTVERILVTQESPPAPRRSAVMSTLTTYAGSQSSSFYQQPKTGYDI